MGLQCNIGGARRMFDGRVGDQVAGALGSAFGDGDWDGTEPGRFGQFEDADWTVLQDRAADELGADELPNLLTLACEGSAVYLPSNVCAMTLPTSAGQIRCASLPGLRRELFELAERWELPLDDLALEGILRTADDPEDGPMPDARAASENPSCFPRTHATHALSF